MSGKARILVVDDEERSREVLQDILFSQGYEVSQAADGMEALKKLKGEGFDVIFLDIRMPRMDGLAATRRIKSDPELRHIPLVIVTGLDDDDLRVEALRLGADDFLVKPPRLAELTARVRSLVKVKAYHDHLVHYQKELEAEVEKRTQQLREALKRLAQSHRKLKESSLDTIYTLSRASEYRDEETAAHIQRLSLCAAAVARQLGMEKDRVETILYASPMHDIGKIGIPDRILLKPGKLNSEEWAIMKQHTTFGGQILSGGSNDFIKVARTIALTHHEKWDGSGYPEGLKGEGIPVEGRITAVVDVFDALTSKRPYKKAYPIERSLQIIRKSAGTRFDPVIVNAFLKIEDEVVAIKERYQNERPSILHRLATDEPGISGLGPNGRNP